MIIQARNFNIKHIAESGQCFRMNPVNENTYSLIAYSQYIELTQKEAGLIELTCDEDEFNSIWKEYFDIDYNYEKIVSNLQTGEDIFLKNAAEFGSGLRILKQEVFETLISFIISQRKSIPAIKSCIEQLCRSFGERKICKECGYIEYYSFPTPERLANANLEDLRKTGLGYRDVYVLNTAKSIINREIDLVNLQQVSFTEAVKQLMNLSGVGIKVANCVSLYGLHHIDAFPIDVWIERILKDVYQNTFDTNKYQGFAGIVQQYMFYYIRNVEYN
jgi:N-glycosylase/DNA lyase